MRQAAAPRRDACVELHEGKTQKQFERLSGQIRDKRKKLQNESFVKTMRDNWTEQHQANELRPISLLILSLFTLMSCRVEVKVYAED